MLSIALESSLFLLAAQTQDDTQATVAVLKIRFLFTKTASLAEWLRRSPRERKIPGSNPVCPAIFPGRVIPVT